MKDTSLQNTTRLVLVLAITLAIFFLTVKPAAAQSPVTAEIDRTSLSTSDTLTLTIRLEGSSAGTPGLPNLDGFQIVGTSQSSQISIINGSMSSQAAYHYVLQPTRVGQLSIPPIAVNVNGQTHTTQSFTIEVTQGTVPSQPPQPQQIQPPDEINPPTEEFNGQDLYVEATVDNPNPYVGEQVTHTFRFYRAVNLSGQPTYEAPNFNGFWNESEPYQTDYDVQLGGRLYRVVELQSILFPTSAGEHTITPAGLNISGSLFSSGTHLQTDVITLNVHPLPVQAPNSFHGAVGEYTIETSVDTDRLSVNEPVTLQVVVSGVGNISNLPDPEMPVINNWRAYESTSTTDTQSQDGIVSGSKTIEQLMVPGSAGDFVIPAIEYTYFNPQTETYQTVSTEPITIHVMEGAAGAPPLSSSQNNNDPIEWPENDIRHIKSAPNSLAMAQKPLVSSAGYWLLWLIPVGALVIDAAWGRRKRFRSQNPDLIRSSNAQKKAHQILVRARKQKSDPYTAVNQALTGYLSDRFNHPVGGMTQADLVKLLEGKGVPPSLIKQTMELLTLGDNARFAPLAENQDSASLLFKETDQLITKLEIVLT